MVAFGEILIDFTFTGTNERGVALFAQNPGGAPGNVCVAVNRLGGTSSFMGKVGDDMHGQLLIDTLEKEGVGTEGLCRDGSVFTTLAFVNTNENGARFFSFARKPGADTQMTFEEMPEELFENGRIYHFGSLSLTHEPARTASFEAVKKAREKGMIISYDPNYRDSLWPDEKTAVKWMRSMLPYADIVKISDEETALLTDFADPEKAAKALVEQGVKIAAVTLGADGALIAAKEGAVLAPGCKPSSIADTNGAGDTFWGAFLYQVAKSRKQPEELTLKELEEFARYANVAASLTCTRSGAIPAMPTAAEVDEFLNA